jgi:probable phosphoglycerate mutase
MRHGRTEWNIQGKLQGRLNSSLLPESIENLHSIGKRLSGFGITAIYSSPLERCRQSAAIISEIVGLPVFYMDDLVECDHGKCEGLSLEEAKNIFPNFFRKRETGDKWNIKWPDGESYADVAARVERAAKRMVLERPALVIAHETVNKVLIGLFLNLTCDEIMQKRQKNNEIFRIDLATKLLESVYCQL